MNHDPSDQASIQEALRDLAISAEIVDMFTTGMPEEAREKANSELNKLKMMSPMSAEATVVRNYIDWMLNVPWKKRSRIRKKLDQAEQILEEDHYALGDVKDRILEFLAVRKLNPKGKSPILCFVGPAGAHLWRMCLRCFWRCPWPCAGPNACPADAP